MIPKIKGRLFGSKEMRNASWIIGGRVIQMLISFIVGILTARYLGPSNYGLINYGATYSLFFTPLCTLGINSVIIKDFVDNPNDIGKTIGTTLLLRFISSINSLLIIWGIINIVDKGESLTISVVMLCSLALVFQVFDTFLYWFQSMYKSKVGAIASVIAYVIVAGYRVILLATGKGILWFAFATVLDYILVAIILFMTYKKLKGPHMSFDFTKAKNLLQSSYHYILSGMMVAIYGQTDKFMLMQMTDERTVGMYSLASTLNFIWVFVLQAIIDSMYPTILRVYSNKEEFEKRNRQLYAVIIYISFVMAIIFCVFGGFIIKLLYGLEYMEAVGPLRIIVWYTIFSYLGVARNAWIVSEEKQKYLKYIYSSAALLNVVLNYFMIPIFGATGAAVTSLITQIMTGIILPFCIKDLRRNAILMVEAALLKNVK